MNPSDLTAEETLKKAAQAVTAALQGLEDFEALIGWKSAASSGGAQRQRARIKLREALRDVEEAIDTHHRSRVRGSATAAGSVGVNRFVG